MITTQKALREEFWAIHSEFSSDYQAKKRQNDYKCDIRVAWVDFVDMMAKDGQISEKLANRATL